MGSMHTGLEETWGGFDRLAAYFAERARGGAGIIVTGGVSPNREGWLKPFAVKLSTRREARKHRVITEAVHAEGGLICLQILHSGRYGYHPSAWPPWLKSPISMFAARNVWPEDREDHRCLCAVRRDVPAGGLRWDRDRGPRGSINQFIVTRTITGLMNGEVRTKTGFALR